MRSYRVRLTLRYTRISCMPMKATLNIDRFVQGADRDDALRQACLCLEQDLDEIMAQINTINVTDIWIEPNEISEELPPSADELWNRELFPPKRKIPNYIVIKTGAR